MARTKRIKLVALLAGLSVISSLTASAAVAEPAATSAGCSQNVLVLRSLNVEAHPAKTVVRRGEKVKVHVIVTRPAKEDPVGQGIELEPPASAPAENVTVGLSVWVGKRTYFWQVGLTDAKGEDELTLTVPKNAELGDALGAASGRRWIKSDCPDILEDGYTTYPTFLKVVP